MRQRKRFPRLSYLFTQPKCDCAAYQRSASPNISKTDDDRQQKWPLSVSAYDIIKTERWVCDAIPDWSHPPSAPPTYTLICERALLGGGVDKAFRINKTQPLKWALCKGRKIVLDP